MWLTNSLPDLPEQLQSWITDTGSMTKRLREAAKDSFSVQVLNEVWLDREAISSADAKLLQLAPGEKVKLREVYLLVDGAPWLYGRTLFPASTLDDPRTHLQGLGAKPLGEVLFNDPTTIRHPMTFCELTPQDALFKAAKQSASVVCAADQNLWARRSLFTIQSRQLLLDEVFLPAMRPLSPPGPRARL